MCRSNHSVESFCSACSTASSDANWTYAQPLLRPPCFTSSRTSVASCTRAQQHHCNSPRRAQTLSRMHVACCRAAPPSRRCGMTLGDAHGVPHTKAAVVAVLHMQARPVQQHGTARSRLRGARGRSSRQGQTTPAARRCARPNSLSWNAPTCQAHGFRCEIPRSFNAQQ